MKKNILTFLLFISFFTGFSQTVFDKFEKDDKINSTIVNKKMFDLMAKVKVDANDADTKKYLTLIKKLDQLKVFTTTDVNTSKNLLLAANTFLKQNPLDELIRSNDGGKNVRIYVKSTGLKDQINTLLMIIEDQIQASNVTLMLLTGEFSLSELSILTDKMKIPGSETIKKVSK